MVSKPPFPTSGHYLTAIRESTRELRTRANIKITVDAIERLLRSAAFTSSFQRVSAVHGLNLPLKFDSHLEELNLISVLSLLNFASGYRVSLHQQLGRGAWDTIRAFVFSLYITSSSGENLLSSRGMQAINMTKVAELIGVSLHTERPHENLPGVVVGELGGPLYDLVKQVTEVMNQTGAILVSGGYPNLGSFILEALKEGGRSTNQDSGALEVVLERLVKAFPAFQDMAIVDGQPVYCFKKALFLIHAIKVRFGTISPLPFPIPSTKDNPVFTDNVIPSMLIHLGVLDLSQAPGLSGLFPSANSEQSLRDLLGPAPEVKSNPKIQPRQASTKAPKEGPVLSNDQAFKLRAAAIDACEMIVSHARSLGASSPEPLEQGSTAWIREITLPELDMWLWSVAKDRSDYRALERFAQRDTVFY
ncbi:hypothetical protein D9756_007403 [Leucocoprinus leucothites]|uniref:Queuosine 5'-phosphate N-glycosylase/hydrolase n=1 Tax=Leucocoprinus leucothites TaxID=201217 RepID=A0A8H5D1C4_9AGAR|nr:hypothetical protein D9756_007403 [Leucoagaricus leucothites]